MPDDRCPWCGAASIGQWSDGPRYYDCGAMVTVGMSARSRHCQDREVGQLKARVTRLESALRTIADTHGAGTLAGDAARNVLEEVRT